MPAGRPPIEYDPETHPAMAGTAAAEGKINREIADDLGISVGTLWKWTQQYPELLSAIKTGKKLADQEIERSLYRRALGYDTTEEKGLVVGNGPYAHVEVVNIKRHVPADTTSMIFWLKNRNPKEWRDKIEQDLTHSGNVTINLTRTSFTKPDDNTG